MDCTRASSATVIYEWSPWGLTSIQYPDVWQWNGSALVVAQAGRTLTMNYDDVHRPTKMIDMAIPYPYQVATATWTAAGQLATFTAPDGTETFQYNVLGQMTDQNGRGVHIGYEYSATQNDGRIQRKRDYTGGEVVEYSYDDLGRLGTARTTDTAAWGLSFSYDRWGNRTNQSVTAGTGPTSNLTYNGMTNRIADAGFSYDLNGNMTQWPAGVTATAAYDLENRVTQVTSFGGTEYYGYGVGAQRVWKQRPNGQRDYFFYGLSGEVLGVYQMQTAGGQTFFGVAGPRVYFAGRQVLPKAVTDRLGSVVSTDTGSFKYFPYGEQQGGASQEEQQKYATYWRDGATGLDYAVNRYFSSQMGRFLSADPYQASGGAAEPGSWNRYAYVVGDPVNSGDPSGLMVVSPAVERLIAACRNDMSFTGGVISSAFCWAVLTSGSSGEDMTSTSTAIDTERCCVEVRSRPIDGWKGKVAGRHSYLHIITNSSAARSFGFLSTDFVLEGNRREGTLIFVYSGSGISSDHKQTDRQEGRRVCSGPEFCQRIRDAIMEGVSYNKKPTTYSVSAGMTCNSMTYTLLNLVGVSLLGYPVDSFTPSFDIDSRGWGSSVPGM